MYEDSRFATKVTNILQKDEKRRINRSTVKEEAQFCETVQRQNTPIIQLWSNFFANRAIYGVKDTWKILVIINQGNEWQNVLLVREGQFQCLKP